MAWFRRNRRGRHSSQPGPDIARGTYIPANAPESEGAGARNPVAAMPSSFAPQFAPPASPMPPATPAPSSFAPAQPAPAAAPPLALHPSFAPVATATAPASTPTPVASPAMHGITEPSEADRTWLTALTTAMPPLDSEEDLRGLSEMFDAQKAFWHASPPEERDEPHSIVNVFAASVGEYVAARCGLRWASITDEHGTEMGLTDQAGSIAVFPINGIAKRWSGEAPGTLADYAFAIIQGLDHR